MANSSLPGRFWARLRAIPDQRLVAGCWLPHWTRRAPAHHTKGSLHSGMSTWQTCWDARCFRALDVGSPWRSGKCGPCREEFATSATVYSHVQSFRIALPPLRKLPGSYADLPCHRGRAAGVVPGPAKVPRGGPYRLPNPSMYSLPASRWSGKALKYIFFVKKIGAVAPTGVWYVVGLCRPLGRGRGRLNPSLQAKVPLVWQVPKSPINS